MEGGVDLFQLTNEDSLAFIKACENLYNRFTPFSVYEDLGEGKIDLSKLPKTGFAEVHGGEATQNSSYDLESLFENYCSDYAEEPLDEEKIKLEMQKFQRKEKIVKIETTNGVKPTGVEPVKQSDPNEIDDFWTK